MSRELLLGVVTEVGRRLAAGGAGGAAGLSRHAAGLRELARQVPALSALAGALERFAAVPANSAAFLDLLALSRQVRAGLAAAGAEGPLAAALPGGPWQTPAASGDVCALHEALAEKGGKWADLWPGAVERGTVGDLRLLTALLGALERSGGVGEAAAGQGLPAFGPAVLPELTERLDLRGKSADARRLLAVCKIDARRGAELCRAALERGSTPLRIQALECLPEVGRPGEAEEAGLRFCREKNMELRAAALSALRDARSDEALDALVRALDEEGAGTPWRSAQRALQRLPHPKATARLAREIETRVAALSAALEGAKGEAKVVGPDHSALLTPVARLVVALSFRPDDPETVVGTLVPLTRHAERRLRWEGVHGLGFAQAATPEALAAFQAALTDPKGDAVEEALRSLSHLPPEKREPLIPDVLDLLRRRQSLKEIAHLAADLLTAHTGRYGERIVQSLRGLPGHEDWHVRYAGWEAAQKIGPAAGPLLPELLRSLRDYEGRPSFPGAFAAIDPEGTTAVPALVRLLTDARPQVKCQALLALYAYGPKAHAAQAEVAKLLTDSDRVVRTHAEETFKVIRTE